MSTLIKNGRIVTAVDDYNADIFIEDEKITQIGKNLEMGADKVIDASNRLVIPGGIDPHTHFDMPRVQPVVFTFTGICKDSHRSEYIIYYDTGQILLTYV